MSWEIVADWRSWELQMWMSHHHAVCSGVGVSGTVASGLFVRDLNLSLHPDVHPESCFVTMSVIERAMSVKRS